MRDIGLISVIMAAYNAEKTIAMALTSVLGQTYKNIEVIVINDCSKDRTEEIVRRFSDSRIRLLNNSNNLGVSYTRHVGVKEAKGNWIAILDSDDMWRPDKLEKQVKMQIEKNAEFLFTGSAFINVEGNPIEWIMHVPSEINYKKLLKQNLVSNSSVLIKKELYQQSEVLNDTIHEDFACWLHVLRKIDRAYGIDEPLLIYRISKSSKSGNKLKAAKMNWNTYCSLGLNLLEASYYMVWYTIKGLIKYRNIKR